MNSGTSILENKTSSVSLATSLEDVIAQALDYLKQKNYPLAADFCERALRLAPTRPDLWTLRGILHKYSSAFPKAEQSYQHALSLNSHYMDASFNLARLYCETDRAMAAVPLLRHIIAHEQRDDALKLLFEIQFPLKQWQDLVQVCRPAVQTFPNWHEARWQLGFALHQLQQPVAALEQLQLIPVHSVRYVIGLQLQAELHAQAGDLAPAIALLESLQQIGHSNPILLHNLGAYYTRLQQHNKARLAYEQALLSGSREASTRGNLADLCYVMGDSARALELYASLESDGSLTLAHRQLQEYLRQKNCDWSHLPQLRERLLKPCLAAGETGPVLLPFPFLVFPIAIDEAEQAAIATRFSRYIASMVTPLQPAKAYVHARPRIGYLSADFADHATTHLIKGLFAHHDREQIEVFAYALNVGDGSAYRQQLEQDAEHFIDLSKLNDADAASRIRSDEIEILIDLKGYTKDARAAILAYRPAPVQISWLGYPGPMNAEFIDYVLTDKSVTPPESQAHYRERFLYLPNSYQLNDKTQVISERSYTREELGLPAQGFVFAAFSGLYKIDPEIFAIWLSVLQQVPDSVLWLIDGPELAKTNLRRAATQSGIDPARLVFAPKWPKAEHLARSRCADLFLDSWRCNGHTTLSDALWAGLPALTVQGLTFATRVGASLLKAAGLPELICQSLPQYEQLALQMVRNPAQLLKIRAHLHDHKLTLPLFDTAAFVKALEAIYRQLLNTDLITGPNETTQKTDHASSPAEAALSSSNVEPQALLWQALEAYNAVDNERCSALLAQVMTRAEICEAYVLRAMLARRLGCGADCERDNRHALQLNPKSTDAWNNLGNLYLNENLQYEAALRCFDKALALNPAALEPGANRGRALRELNRHREAIAAFRAVIAQAPDNADAHWDLALSLLTNEQCTEGFAEYEWRWQRGQPAPRGFAQPQWQGQAITGKTLLIYAEQGLGDTLQCLRFLEQAQLQSGANIVLEVQAALKSLVTVQTYRQPIVVLGQGEALPAFDFHIPLITLAHLFAIQVKQLSGAPYLQIPAGSRAHWQERIEALVVNKDIKRPRYGLIWAGNPNVKNDKKRSPRLAPLWDWLVQRTDCDFFILQQGDGRRDLESRTLPAHLFDIASEAKDFVDTGAIMSAMDGVITSDTSTAHLAGALGVKTKVLLPFADDWRWLHKRKDSPWYGSLTLLRQPMPAAWPAVVQALDLSLPKVTGKKNPKQKLLATKRSAERLSNKTTAVTAPVLPAYIVQAFEHYQRTQTDAALRLLAALPANAYPEGWTLRGILHKQTQQLAQAREDYETALRIAPEFVDAWNNLGNLLRVLNEPDAAIQAYRNALRLRPESPEIALSLLDLLREQGALEDAEVILQKWLAQQAHDPRWRLQQGNLAMLRKDIPQALACFKRLTELTPDFMDGWYNYGVALQAVEDHRTALGVYEHLLSKQPQHLKALYNAGIACQKSMQFERGEQFYAALLALSPTHYQAQFNLAGMNNYLGRNDAAIKAYERALELKPASIHVRAERAHILQKRCDWREFTRLREQVIQPAVAGEFGDAPISPFMFQVFPVPITEAEQYAIARHHAAGIEKDWPARFDFSDRLNGLRLRIGYVSADMHNHATAHLMRGLFRRHDRSRFEIFIYSQGPDDGSEYRRGIASDVDHFVDVSQLSAQATADRIYADEVDLLIDLKGYTRDARPEVFAQRPAPLQLSWLGYPGTSASRFIDYMITDEVVSPPATQAFYSEQFAYMPHSYQINDNQQVIGPAPSRTECGLPETGFVFCCFCTLYKIEPTLWAAWMRLLQAVPDSVLWLIDGEVVAMDNLRAQAQAAGVAPERLVFAPKRDKAAHLARHVHADLFLDTWSCNAHTTAADALWAGLPVLTCPGETFATRVGASLLQAIGLPELIAEDLPAYERKAIALASMPGASVALKQKLAQNRLARPLFDTDRFVRDLEALYLRLWQTHQRRDIHILQRYAGLGDMLMLTPCARALRAAGKRTVVETTHVFADGARACPDFDEVLVNPELRTALTERARVCGQSLQTHAMSAARFAFAVSHQTEAYARDLELYPLADASIRLHSTGTETARVAALLDQRNQKAGNGPLVLLHPAQGDANRTWPTAHWQTLYQHLKARGWRVLAIGAQNSGDPAKTAANLVLEPADDWLNLLSVGELLALCQHADLIVSSDSGPLHVAAGTDIGIVGFYSVAAASQRWPFRHGQFGWRCRALESSCAFFPCYRHLGDEALTKAQAQGINGHALIRRWCPDNESYACMCTEYTVDKVLAAIDALWQDIQETLLPAQGTKE